MPLRMYNVYIIMELYNVLITKPQKAMINDIMVNDTMVNMLCQNIADFWRF
jgi:hypothetical protein